MTVLALLVVCYALTLLFVPGARPPFLQERYERIPLAVLIHIGASAVAMGLGPFQFVASLRNRRPDIHRWMGRFYLGGVFAGGAAGFVMATMSQLGIVTHAGFALLALTWIFTGVRAYQRIRAGDDVEHRRWMIRNFSLTLAAVTLRIYVPVSLALGVPFEIAYAAIAWLAWIPNLFVAELIVRRTVPARRVVAAI
jgi:uncharacterized membrane protein